MKWSKLQKALYNIVDPDMNFQMQCSVFWTRSSWGTKKGKGRETIPRYWITLGKDVVWDFPGMFLDCEASPDYIAQWTVKQTYHYRDNYT